jgi:tetratricopeptide (TPR) repeat protein
VRRLILALLLLAWFGCHKKQQQQQLTTVAKVSNNNDSPLIAAQAARERADIVFENRDDPKKLLDAISLYEKAAALDNSRESWLRLARAYELLGRLQKDTQEGRREAAKHYATGLKAAAQALEIISPGSTDKLTPVERRLPDLSKNAAEALYQYALLTWRWAQTQGTAIELSVRGEVMAAAQKAAGLEPNLMGAAPYRLLGELYAELPVFAFGNLDASKDYFQKAINLAPDALENRGAFARSYSKKAAPESIKTFLEEIQNADPNLMKELAPENRLEQKRAKVLLEAKQ